MSKKTEKQRWKVLMEEGKFKFHAYGHGAWGPSGRADFPVRVSKLYEFKGYAVREKVGNGWGGTHLPLHESS